MPELNRFRSGSALSGSDDRKLRVDEDQGMCVWLGSGVRRAELSNEALGSLSAIAGDYELEIGASNGTGAGSTPCPLSLNDSCWKPVEVTSSPGSSGERAICSPSFSNSRSLRKWSLWLLEYSVSDSTISPYACMSRCLRHTLPVTVTVSAHTANISASCFASQRPGCAAAVQAGSAARQ